MEKKHQLESQNKPPNDQDRIKKIDSTTSCPRAVFVGYKTYDNLIIFCIDGDACDSAKLIYLKVNSFGSGTGASEREGHWRLAILCFVKIPP